jgi:hypothetical protein
VAIGSPTTYTVADATLGTADRIGNQIVGRDEDEVFQRFDGTPNDELTVGDVADVMSDAIDHHRLEDVAELGGAMLQAGGETAVAALGTVTAGAATGIAAGVFVAASRSGRRRRTEPGSAEYTIVPGDGPGGYTVADVSQVDDRGLGVWNRYNFSPGPELSDGARFSRSGAEWLRGLPEDERNEVLEFEKDFFADNGDPRERPPGGLGGLGD